MLEYDEKLRLLMEKPESLIEILYEGDFWGRSGLKGVDFNVNHFKFIKDWVDDSVADAVYDDWDNLELGTNISIAFKNEPSHIKSEVTPLFFRDEFSDGECGVGCCRQFVITYTMLEEHVSKAVSEILLYACLIDVEYAPTDAAPGLPGPGMGSLEVAEPEITSRKIDFKVSYNFSVNDSDYVNSQLHGIAAPILLEKYTSEFDHVYNDSVEFLEYFTDFMAKHSNYSQFHTPVNQAKLLEEQKVFEKIQSGVSGEDEVGDDDPPNIKDTGFHDVVLESVKFSGSPVNWTTPDPYIDSISNSGFQDPVNKTYRENYDPWQFYRTTKPDLMSTLLKLEVLGIQVSNYTQNSLININEYQTFDAFCFRLDFDSVLKQTGDSTSAISMSLRFPKLITEKYDSTYLRTFPRRFYKTKNPISSDAVMKQYNWDNYALIHPKSLKTPFVNSPEAVRIMLKKSTKLKTFVTKTDYEYQHDFLNTSRKCSTTAKPVEQCLYEAIKCEPLSNLSSCDFNIQEPIDPISPEKEGCYPTACEQTRISLNQIIRQSIEICESTDDIENEYLRDAYMTCSQHKTLNTTTINSALLNEHSKNKQATHQRLLDQCENSFSNFASQPNLCKVLADAQEYELYQIDISYSDTFDKVISEVEVDSWDQMAIDIIGSLGFFLGFSVITFAEFFMFFSDIVGTYFRRGTNKVTSE